MLVMDTHVLVWWVSDSRSLSAVATQAIEDTLAGGDEIIISSISAWEIAMLVGKGRLAISMDLESWLAEVSRIEGVRFMPVNNDIAVKSTRLPDIFHKDPADRMIVATARSIAAPLVTADEKILAYEYVNTIW